MLRRSVFCFAVVFLAFSGYAQADDSISGLWEDVSHPMYKGSIMVVSQHGEKVVFACSWNRGVWHALGTRKGNKVSTRITHTKYPPEFTQVGKHELVVSADGKTMTGKWSNLSGTQSGNLKFVRKK